MNPFSRSQHPVSARLAGIATADASTHSVVRAGHELPAALSEGPVALANAMVLSSVDAANPAGRHQSAPMGVSLLTDIVQSGAIRCITRCLYNKYRVEPRCTTLQSVEPPCTPSSETTTPKDSVRHAKSIESFRTQGSSNEVSLGGRA